MSSGRKLECKLEVSVNVKHIPDGGEENVPAWQDQNDNWHEGRYSDYKKDESTIYNHDQTEVEHFLNETNPL